MDSISTSSRARRETRQEILRPIYYLGCKASFIPSIRAAIDEVDPSGGMLCDLFSGSGVVASAMSMSRPVTTVDVQEYSRVLCSALLRPAKLSMEHVHSTVRAIAQGDILQRLRECVGPLIEYETAGIVAARNDKPDRLVGLLESLPLATCESEPPTSDGLWDVQHDVLRRLRAAGLERSPDSLMTRYFGGVYFSFAQSIALDAILSYATGHSERARDTLTAAALSTASMIVNSVGKQFAQPIRPRNKDGRVKSNLAKMASKDRLEDALETYASWLTRYVSLPRPRHATEVLRDDYLDAIVRDGSGWRCAYADPPYTRDHYSRFYHVLETMCLRDEPRLSRVTKGGRSVLSRGMYREDRHQSLFCIRSTAAGAFESLFRAASERSLPLVLSYSPHESGDGTHPRVLPLSQINELARAHYARVEIVRIDGVAHNKLNRSDLQLKTREHAELLFKCYV